MVRFFHWLAELLMRHRKKPWGRFIVSGISEDGQVRFEMAYNKALLKNLYKHKLQGANDEETITNFLLGTIMYPKDLDNVQSEEHPYLPNDAKDFRRG